MIEVFSKAPKLPKFLGPLVPKQLYWFLRSNSTAGSSLWSLFPPPPPILSSIQKDPLHDGLLLCTKCHTRNGSYLKVYIIDYVSLVGIARNHRLWRERIPAIRSIKSSYFTHFTSTLAILGMIHRIKHMDFTQYISIIHLGRLGRLEMINSFLLYWLFTLLLIVLNLLLKRSIWGRSVTFSFPNITPFATCYHVGTRGDV